MDMRTLRCLEMSGTDYPVARRHFPEERNPQLHRCENLRTYIKTNSITHKFIVAHAEYMSAVIAAVLHSCEEFIT
jgi:hypothetical protein